MGVHPKAINEFSSVLLLGAEDAPDIAALEEIYFPTPWTAQQYAENMIVPASVSSGLLHHRDFSVLARAGVAFFVFGVRESATHTLVAYFAFMMHHAAQELEIYNIAVSQRVRGMGLGKKMLQHTLPQAIALGIERGVLEVRKGNEAAIGLYKHFGFTVAGERKNYYSDPVENAYIMCCDWTQGLLQPNSIVT